MLRIFVIAMFTFFLASCDYELSPWKTEAYCPGLEIEFNIDRLNKLESVSQLKQSFSFAVIGDPQQYPGYLENTIEALNQFDDVDFIMLLGDIAETGLAQEFEWACEALQKAQKPILAVIGNHDAISFGKQIWGNAFGPEDYSFTYMNTKFVAFNNNQYEYSTAPNLDFLQQEAQIAENETRALTLGFSHIQPWDNQPNLSKQLQDLGYDHMFHAHEHKFRYWQYEEVGLPHYIVADTRFVKFAIVEVSGEDLSIMQCEPVCYPAELNSVQR